MIDYIKELEKELFSNKELSNGSCHVYAKVYSNGEYKLIVNFLYQDKILIQNDSGCFKLDWTLQTVQIGKWTKDQLHTLSILEERIQNWIDKLLNRK
jgi:hypothetical protein